MARLVPPIDELRSFVFRQYIKDPKMVALLNEVVERKTYFDSHRCAGHAPGECGNDTCSPRRLKDILLVHYRDDGGHSTSRENWVSPLWRKGSYHAAWPLFVMDDVLRMSCASSGVHLQADEMRTLRERRAEILLSQRMRKKESQVVWVPTQTFLLVLTHDELSEHWKKFLTFSDMLKQRKLVAREEADEPQEALAKRLKQ
jgi:hypothetical protein